MSRHQLGLASRRGNHFGGHASEIAGAVPGIVTYHHPKTRTDGLVQDRRQTKSGAQNHGGVHASRSRAHLCTQARRTERQRRGKDLSQALLYRGVGVFDLGHEGGAVGFVGVVFQPALVIHGFILGETVRPR